MTQQKIQANCLKIPKDLGEKAISILKKLDLINKELKIQSSKESVYVPLKQKPSLEYLHRIKQVLPQFDFFLHNFIMRKKNLQKTFNDIEESCLNGQILFFPKSIDFVGDIAIVEIPYESRFYKKYIGNIILKIHKRVQTVLAKSSAIKGVYRLREFEVIAGSPKTETFHKEQGCKYQIDLKKMYFSPRLSHEHLRVASQIKENEVLIDMFAGVGPFSILIAKTHRNIIVYAIDINPKAVEYLKKNIFTNRVQDKVIPILGNAKAIIKNRFQGKVDRVIMNLPETAKNYLEIACKAIKPEGGIIHYYDLIQGKKSLGSKKEWLIKKVTQNGRNVEEFISTKIVREVAPYKWQIVIDMKIK
jgi:tRNA (guanine37-N1)-methyltransferase